MPKRRGQIYLQYTDRPDACHCLVGYSGPQGKRTLKRGKLDGMSKEARRDAMAELLRTAHPRIR